MRELRAARPSDVSLVARVLEMAGRGHLPRGPWDLMFPEEGERSRALARVAGGTPSWCHYGVFRVAEQDGVPGAALCAFEPSKLGGTELAGPLVGVFAELGWAPQRMAALGPLLAPYLRCFPAMPDGTWILENVGCLPECRRRGLVGALLEAALEDGRREGHRQAQISCLIGNQAAHRAYESVGFRVIEAREDAEFAKLLGAPGFVRMTVAL